MARHTEGSILRLGAVSLVVLLVVRAAAFNLQKFPGFKGTDYHVQLADASGLHKGNMVQVAGIRVGRVDGLHISENHVTVDINVKDAELGKKTQASVQVLNLLGEKYLELTPKGSGEMEEGDTVPVSRTNGSYDIVSTLSELTTTTEAINVPQLSKALTTLGDTVNSASPHIRSTFTGLSGISRSIASRDESIQQLLGRAERVTKLLSERRGDLVKLMKQGELVFQELITRREAIHSLLVNARRLAVELRGLATDNQAQIGDALKQLNTALKFLRAREKQIDTTLTNLGPYASILINIIGTGPWFDAFVPNLADIGDLHQAGRGRTDEPPSHEGARRRRDRRDPPGGHRGDPHGHRLRHPPRDGVLRPHGQPLQGLRGAGDGRQHRHGHGRGPRGGSRARRDGVRRRVQAAGRRQGRDHHAHAHRRSLRAGRPGVHRRRRDGRQRQDRAARRPAHRWSSTASTRASPT